MVFNIYNIPEQRDIFRIKNTLISLGLKYNSKQKFYYNDVALESSDEERLLDILEGSKYQFTFKDSIESKLDPLESNYKIIHIDQDNIFIALRVNNKKEYYLNRNKGKITIFDKNRELLDYQEILKSIFKIFNEMKIVDDSKSEAINYTLKGKLSKNFEYKENEISYEFNNVKFVVKNMSTDGFAELSMVFNIFIDNELIFDNYKTKNNIELANKLVEKYNLHEWKTYQEYLFANEKLKSGNGFILELDNDPDEKLMIKGIGTIEQRIKDCIEQNSENLIIKIAEHIMNKKGIFQFLKKELQKAQVETDYYPFCSDDIIKEILKKYTAKTKEFELELSGVLHNIERIDLY